MANSDFSVTLARVLRRLLLLAPLAAYLWHFPAFGRLPDNDYFWFLIDVSDAGHLSSDPLRWLLARSNEHLVAIPALIYLLNIVTNAGNALVLSAWSLLMLTVAVLLIDRLLPAPLRDGRTIGGLLAALSVGTLGITVAAVHNIALGFSGVMWLTANAWMLAALTCLVRGGPRPRPWPFLGTFVFAGLAIFTYSTGQTAWPALLVAGLALGLGRRRLLALVFGLAASLTIYAWWWQPLPHHAEAAVRSTGQALIYFGTYLGGPLLRSGLAPAAGWAGVALAVTLVGFALRRRRSQPTLLPALAPWLALVVYGMINGIGTSLGRSGLGPAQATNSRYATLATLFWIGLMVGWYLLLAASRNSDPSPRRLALLPLVAGSALGLSGLITAWPLLRSHLERSAWEPAAALSLQLGLRDEQVVRFAMTPRPEQVFEVVPLLRNLGHVPFDRPLATLASRPLAPRFDHPPAGVRGELDQWNELGDWLRIGGWVEVAGNGDGDTTAPAHPPVAILDRRGRQRGHVVTGLTRRGADGRKRPTGFTAYVPAVAVANAGARAYIFLPATGARAAGWYALPINQATAGLRDQLHEKLRRPPEPATPGAPSPED